MPPKTNNPQLEDEVSKIKRFVTEMRDLELPTEFLQNSNRRYSSKAINDAGEQEVLRLLQRGEISYVHRDDIWKDDIN